MKFQTKPLLRIYRYGLLLILIGVPIMIMLMAFNETMTRKEEMVYPLVMGSILLIAGGMMVHIAFWEKCFASLTISESSILWKCPFRRPLSIPVEECTHIGVQLEESWTDEIEYPMIYFSTTPYPFQFFNKINKVKCKNGFIKFWYSEELCDYLIATFPYEKTKQLTAFKTRQILKKKQGRGCKNYPPKKS